MSGRVRVQSWARRRAGAVVVSVVARGSLVAVVVLVAGRFRVVAFPPGGWSVGVCGYACGGGVPLEWLRARDDRALGLSWVRSVRLGFRRREETEELAADGRAAAASDGVGVPWVWTRVRGERGDLRW